MINFALRDNIDNKGRLVSVIASVPLSDYAVRPSGLGTAHVMDQMVNMAEECFGHLLSGVGEGNDGGFEFDFPGNAEAATYEGMGMEQHIRHTALLFSSLINHPTWQIAQDIT